MTMASLLTSWTRRCYATRAGEPYSIRTIPTQVFFDADGNQVWRHEGLLPKADFVVKFAELGVK